MLEKEWIWSCLMVRPFLLDWVIMKWNSGACSGWWVVCEIQYHCMIWWKKIKATLLIGRIIASGTCQVSQHSKIIQFRCYCPPSLSFGPVSNVSKLQNSVLCWQKIGGFFSVFSVNCGLVYSLKCNVSWFLCTFKKEMIPSFQKWK